jgi:hypothetical protein
VNVKDRPSLHDLLAHLLKLVDVDGISHMHSFFEWVSYQYIKRCPKHAKIKFEKLKQEQTKINGEVS